MKVISPLLGKKHSISDAERTFALAASAARDGNLRLAVSRGLTAVIQASVAARGASPETQRRAEIIVQSIRDIIHGAVLRQTALGAIPRSMQRILERVHPPFRRPIGLKTGTKDNPVRNPWRPSPFPEVPTLAPFEVPWRKTREELRRPPDPLLFFTNPEIQQLLEIRQIDFDPLKNVAPVKMFLSPGKASIPTEDPIGLVNFLTEFIGIPEKDIMAESDAVHVFGRESIINTRRRMTQILRPGLLEVFPGKSGR